MSSLSKREILKGNSRNYFGRQSKYLIRKSSIEYEGIVLWKARGGGRERGPDRDPDPPPPIGWGKARTSISVICAASSFFIMDKILVKNSTGRVSKTPHPKNWRCPKNKDAKNCMFIIERPPLRRPGGAWLLRRFLFARNFAWPGPCDNFPNRNL